jgi:hypothetical protein
MAYDGYFPYSYAVATAGNVTSDRKASPLPKVSMAIDAEENVCFSLYFPTGTYGLGLYNVQKLIGWSKTAYEDTPNGFNGQDGSDICPINQYTDGLRLMRYTPHGMDPVDLVTEIDNPPGDDVFFRVDGVM